MGVFIPVKKNSIYVVARTHRLLAAMQTIPFDDIAPGAEVRFAVIDGKQYLSVRDVIMCICGVDANEAGRIWRRLSPQRKDEIQTTAWLKFQFGGCGHSSQPGITFPGAVKLVMFLPGEKAKTSRSVMANILQRYYEGDETLYPEIRANSLAANPVTRVAHDLYQQIGDAAVEQQQHAPNPEVHTTPGIFLLSAHFIDAQYFADFHRPSPCGWRHAPNGPVQRSRPGPLRERTCSAAKGGKS